MKLQNADTRQDLEVLHLEVDKAMTKMTIHLDGISALNSIPVIVEIPFAAVMEAVARGTGKL